MPVAGTRHYPMELIKRCQKKKYMQTRKKKKEVSEQLPWILLRRGKEQ